ncbi:hypothetical protein AB0302_07450 [Micrococcus sp. NPDC078436]|uniref:hypothetical protein n=1 Tax=Micrococcus sp. NPDC078436 TaxID=3154960 RepID=UPI00344ED520
MMGDGMMTEVLIGSGWAGLLACMVVGAIARLPLAAAGKRRAVGRPWAGHAALGLGLVALALAAALSALGSFFGLMGLAFAAIMAVGAWQSFAAAERRRRAAQEQIDHAARLGAAFQGSRAASGTHPGGEAGVDDGLGARSPAAPPASADRRPGWYSSEGPDRQGPEPR